MGWILGDLFDYKEVFVSSTGFSRFFFFKCVTTRSEVLVQAVAHAVACVHARTDPHK